MNECLDNNDNCHDQANCLNTNGSYTCSCKIGYSGDGFNCEGSNFIFDSILYDFVCLSFFCFLFKGNITNT